METIQANFLKQLKMMGSRYCKVLPTNINEISSKKVSCHLFRLFKKKDIIYFRDMGEVYRIGGRFNFIKCEDMVIRYTEQRFRMPMTVISGQ